MTKEERKIYEKIVKEVDAHIKERCFTVTGSSWYSGITNNVNQRFGNHKKTKNIMYFKSWDTKSFEVARELEFYHARIGFGNSDNLGNAKEDSKYFYVFKKDLGLVEGIMNFFGTTYNDKKPKEVKISKKNGTNKK